MADLGRLASQRALVRTYRTGDDYRRYSWENAKRRRSLTRLYRRYRRYFGRRLVDVGCGGGVLGGVVEPHGHTYVGIDANPDMIRQARTVARERSSRMRFILGDAIRCRLAGVFDTVALLGNGLSHFSTLDLGALLDHRRKNVHRGSTFIVDYRDLIAMFWNGSWSRVKVQTFVRGRVVHRARSLDLDRGILRMRAQPSSREWLLNWSHAIWSPFILQSVMAAHGWQLIHRQAKSARADSVSAPEAITDVYRLGRTPIRRKARPAIA